MVFFLGVIVALVVVAPIDFWLWTKIDKNRRDLARWKADD